MTTFSEALNAGLDLADELEVRSHRRRAAWICSERRRSWGRGFACGVVACLLIAGALRVSEAWGATRPAPAAIQLVVDRLVRHRVPDLMADCRARTCAAYSNVGQLQLVLRLDYLPERSAIYYRVVSAVA